MLIRVGYEIAFELPAAASMLALLQVHPSRVMDLREPDEIAIQPATAHSSFTDVFGNRCCRMEAKAGRLRLTGRTLIEDSGAPQAEDFDAREHPVAELPIETLQFLLSSRYCEVDRMSAITADLFGGARRGWDRVTTICDWIKARTDFGYGYASPFRTAVDTYLERRGVCRDFQHLAITMCRALNIPARYVAGYLGDIGVPPAPEAMDFSAWFEVYLSGQWWVFDARHRTQRIGRVPIAIGRDAADVAITTTFGRADLVLFRVTTEEEPRARVVHCGPPDRATGVSRSSDG